MASVRVESGDTIQANTTGISSSWTVCGWTYFTTDRNDYSCIVAAQNGASYALCETENDGVTLNIYSAEAPNSYVFNGVITTGNWYWWAFSSNGTRVKFRLVIDGGSTFTVDTTSSTAALPLGGMTELWLMGNSYSEFLNGELTCVKVFSSELSNADALAERTSRSAIAASPWAVWNLESATNDAAGYQDSSGNGRHLSVSGIATGVQSDPTDLVPPLAITVGNVTTFNGLKYDGSGPITHDHDGDCLVVMFTSGYPADSTHQPTGITWNGVALTARTSIAASTNCQARIWGDPAVATGSHDVVFDWSASDEAYIVLYVISLIGVHQTTAFGTGATATGSSTTPSVNVSSASDELVIDALSVAVTASGRTATVGASQTQIANVYSADGDTGSIGASSYEAGDTTTTMSWTISTSQVWAIAGVSVKPVGDVYDPPVLPYVYTVFKSAV